MIPFSVILKSLLCPPEERVDEAFTLALEALADSDDAINRRKKDIRIPRLVATFCCANSMNTSSSTTTSQPAFSG